MAEKEGTTIRVYTDKKEYHEEAGFTLWAVCGEIVAN